VNVIRSLDQYEPSQEPVSLTIGFFDGVHLGHRHIFSAVKKRAKGTKGKSVVITFENHPTEVLRPDRPVELITPLSQKIALIASLQIDVLLLLRFTREFAEQTAKQFLRSLVAHLPISTLVMGYDAKLGKDRQGSEKIAQTLASPLGFTVEVTPPYRIEGIPLSSSRIREEIKKAKFLTLETLLGRRYSLVLPLSRRKAELSLKGLCTPPSGVYCCECRIRKKPFHAIAYIDSFRELTVYLIDGEETLCEEEVEVFPIAALRNETEGLEKDILAAKKFFSSR